MAVDAGRTRRAPKKRWRASLLCFVGLVFAGIALSQLQGLLTGMHISGQTASGIGGLNHVFHPGADPQHTADAIDVWHRYSFAVDQPRVEPASGYEVVWWAVLVDSFFFAPLYAFGIYFFLQSARATLTGTSPSEQALTAPPELEGRFEEHRLDEGKALVSYSKIAGVGMGLILVALGADELENAMNLAVVHHGWFSSPPYSDDGWFQVFAWVLWIAAGVKWLFALLAVLAALSLGWVLLANRLASPARGWKVLMHRIVLLGLQVVLLVLLAGFLFATDQVPDLIRRWSPLQLGIDVALVWAFALVLWFVGHGLLTGDQLKVKWDEARRRKVKHRLFGGLAALALAQLLLNALTPHGYRSGWGLFVPLGILSVLAVLGLLVPKGLGGTSPPLGAAVKADPKTEPSPALPRLFAAIAVGALAAGVLHASFGYAVYRHGWSTGLLLVVGGAGLGLAASRFVRRLDPLVWAGAGALAGLVVLAIVNNGELSPSVLVVVALLLLAGAIRLYSSLSHLPASGYQLGPKSLGGVALVLAALYALGVADPWVTGDVFSVVGVLLFFLSVVALVGGALTWANPAIPVPRALRIVHVGRFPVLTFLVVWFLVAGYFDPGGYHNARIEADRAAQAKGVTLVGAFQCWLGKNGLAENDCKTATAGSTAAKGAVPLVLVATTGGGIRAAYWTDLVLDCAFEVEARTTCPNGPRAAGFARSNSLFATSGISGGSLGLAAYAAYLTKKESGSPDPGWIEDALDGDSLSASGAWWLLVELPRAFLQFRSPTDRAAVLERGWERDMPELEQGLFDLWRNHHEAPLLLLNGTSVEDGCRFETSVLDGNVELVRARGKPSQLVGCHSTEPFDEDEPKSPDEPPRLDRTRVAPRSVLPATRDLVDFLCQQPVDVRLSTAALLSARFPFVNPAGRIEQRCGDSPPIAYVVDGGYLDTSGASPVAEMMVKLWPLIRAWNAKQRKAATGRCIVPLMIQIDNGFDPGAPGRSRRPGELTIPLSTSFATRIARAAEGRNGAGLDFTRRITSTPAVNRYAHFVNEAHPGPGAPLGWTQSRYSQDELAAQLTQAKNRRALAEVRRWLTPHRLSCRG